MTSLTYLTRVYVLQVSIPCGWDVVIGDVVAYYLNRQSNQGVLLELNPRPCRFASDILWLGPRRRLQRVCSIYLVQQYDWSCFICQSKEGRMRLLHRRGMVNVGRFARLMHTLVKDGVQRDCLSDKASIKLLPLAPPNASCRVGGLPYHGNLQVLAECVDGHPRNKKCAFF